jgi:hypothetical protein
MANPREKPGRRPKRYDDLIAKMREIVTDVRAHDHKSFHEDLFCLNLVAYMGERMGFVLDHVDALDAEVEAVTRPAYLLAGPVTWGQAWAWQAAETATAVGPRADNDTAPAEFEGDEPDEYCAWLWRELSAPGPKGTVALTAIRPATQSEVPLCVCGIFNPGGGMVLGAGPRSDTLCLTTCRTCGGTGRAPGLYIVGVLA